VDAGSRASLAEIQHLHDSAWEAIGTATVDGSKWHHYWNTWQMHCGLYHDAAGKVQAPHILTDQLLTFAVAVRDGQYSNGHQVQVQTVARALRFVSQKLVLDGHPNPRCASTAQHALDLPIARLLKKYSYEDLPPEPKLAIPISTITAIAEKYWWSTHFSAIVDLVIIAFFYLLQAGKYTSPANPRKKWTIPLWGCNIRLWTHDGHLISHSAGLDALLQVESAMVCIAHTKNGINGAVVHRNRGRGPICSIVALAWRVANIQAGPARGNINIVYPAGGRVSRVTDQDIGVAIRWGATSDELTSRGYTLDRVSSHSLRAGGAMALKLSGTSDSTIMRVRQWSSLTYLTYIHLQIGALTAGVAWKMSAAFRFQNVG
jgi:hypothetical protein